MNFINYNQMWWSLLGSPCGPEDSATHQSYTVGLLGVPGASPPPPPPPILAFPRSFFQPSPLGVVAAASIMSRWRPCREIQQKSAGRVLTVKTPCFVFFCFGSTVSSTTYPKDSFRWPKPKHHTHTQTDSQSKS
jgi:hypothetical protein